MIGLPGETVWAKGGHVWIKDKGKPAFQLNEPYTHGKPTNDLPRQTIPPGYYLMLGDNRVDLRRLAHLGPRAARRHDRHRPRALLAARPHRPALSASGEHPRR